MTKTGAAHTTLDRLEIIHASATNDEFIDTVHKEYGYDVVLRFQSGDSTIPQPRLHVHDKKRKTTSLILFESSNPSSPMYISEYDDRKGTIQQVNVVARAAVRIDEHINAMEYNGVPIGIGGMALFCTVDQNVVSLLDADPLVAPFSGEPGSDRYRLAHEMFSQLTCVDDLYEIALSVSS